MNKILRIGAIAGALFGASAAEAAVFDFSYTGGSFSASGEFTTGDIGSPYLVTGITGTADGFAISGLSTYAGANQLLYFPPSGGFYADFSGISFTNENGVSYNITNFPTGASNNLNVSTLDSAGNGSAVVAIDMTVTPAAVPGPIVGAGGSSFALAALFLGWFVRRRGQQLA